MCVLLLLACSGTQAQSLERSYADLCDTPAKKESEACKTLAKAVLDKLQGEAATAADASPSAAWRSRWGLFAEMAGKDFFVWPESGLNAETDLDALERALIRYRWKVPGQSLQMTTQIGDHRTEVLLEWDATQARLLSKEGSPYVVEPDGSLRGLEHSAAGLTTRSRTVRRSDGIIHNTVEQKKDGAWVFFAQGLMAERSPERVATIAAERKRREAAGQALFDAIMAEEAVLEQQKVEREQEEEQARLEQETERQEAMARWNANQQKIQQLLGQPAGSDGATTDAQAGSTTATVNRPAPGRPLRFVLSIGLAPRAGDRVNPTCYSNVITRPGPPGWGQRGFLPPGSGERARATVQGLKSRFIAACRARSGRDITSEGNFHWTWNETQDGEAQIASTRAQNPGDVTVGVQ